MKRHHVLLTCLTFSSFGSQCLIAESIWQRRNPQSAYLFYDSKARYIGDSVTVTIAQTTDVANTEQRKMEKATKADGTFDLAASSAGGFGAQAAKAALELGSTSDRAFDGTSNYATAQTFEDSMTCTVMDVLPNGNMVISGERRVRVAGEERTLVVSGIIRGLDLGPDNTVNSHYISQFRMEYQAGGTSQKFTKQNWLGRTMNTVWPW